MQKMLAEVFLHHFKGFLKPLQTAKKRFFQHLMTIRQSLGKVYHTFDKRKTKVPNSNCVIWNRGKKFFQVKNFFIVEIFFKEENFRNFHEAKPFFQVIFFSKLKIFLELKIFLKLKNFLLSEIFFSQNFFQA